jgi:putative Mg2+ transporter-C (MgtC) family protein
VTAVAEHSSPQTVAGVITGIGFIGAGVVFRATGGLVRGITSAATIFSAAAIGIVVGYGHIALGILTAAGILLTLELRFIPGLRILDSSRHSARFKQEHPSERGRTADQT